MRTVVMDAKVEIQLPDVIEPTEYSQEMYTRRPRVRMKLSIKMDNLVLREPSGRTITLKRVVIDRIDGVILPVIDGDRAVLFEVDEADKPTIVKG